MVPPIHMESISVVTIKFRYVPHTLIIWIDFCFWRIPWTEEPGRLLYIGLQRVEYNLATDHTCKHNIWYS